MRTTARRLARLEERIGTGRDCPRCWGSGAIVVLVPEEERDLAPHTPVTCPGCGAPLRHVTQVIGITEAEWSGVMANRSPEQEGTGEVRAR